MYRYTYCPAIRQLKIKMATQIHATGAVWAAKWIAEGVKVGAWGDDALSCIPGGRLQRFVEEYKGM